MLDYNKIIVYIIDKYIQMQDLLVHTKIYVGNQIIA